MYVERSGRSTWLPAPAQLGQRLQQLPGMIAGSADAYPVHMMICGNGSGPGRCLLAVDQDCLPGFAISDLDETDGRQVGIQGILQMEGVDIVAMRQPMHPG